MERNDHREYKQHKGLTKENLRDNMTNVELALNTLAEVTATEISRQRNPKGMAQSRQTAKEGGEVARNARADIESRFEVLFCPLTPNPSPLTENCKIIVHKLRKIYNFLRISKIFRNFAANNK